VLGLRRAALTQPAPFTTLPQPHEPSFTGPARAQVPDKNVSPVVVCPWSDTAATLLSYTQVLAALSLPDPAPALCISVCTEAT
jgi:hypothetical protein